MDKRDKMPTSSFVTDLLLMHLMLLLLSIHSNFPASGGPDSLSIHLHTGVGCVLASTLCKYIYEEEGGFICSQLGKGATRVPV